MRLTLLLLASLPLLAACGPDPVDTTGTASGTTTATTATTGASTGTATTGATTGATTDTPTTDAPTATTDTPTQSTTTTTGPTTITDTTAGTTGDSTTGTSTDTGAAGLCDDDADCKLADDCCDCDGVPVDLDVPVCDLECDQSKCSELGIAKAVCRFGVCTTPRLSCDASKVACDSLPPPCPPGTLAETTPLCWSGRCVPAKHCDVVDNCDQCPEDRVCVQDVGFGPEPGAVCEPLPPGCDPATPCVCLGEQVCQDPFSACFNQPGGDITCECINC